MEQVRKPFQGVLNIIRFNWHFYVIAMVLIIASLMILVYVDNDVKHYILLTDLIILLSMFISLGVSHWIYDKSGLYELNWITLPNIPSKIVNIHAGFDETSHLIASQFADSDLQVFDFYDADKHTEVSIKRARKVYSTYPQTQTMKTNKLPVDDSSIDVVFNLLSAHEVRDDDERISFFKEMARSIKDDGEIIVTEHLRDYANFLAYNLGFFHFHSKATWLDTFKEAGLSVKKEQKITPFITTFNLIKNGNAS